MSQSSQLNKNSFYRYFYIKNGDVVDQLERISRLGDTGPTSGPDAFIYSFLKNVGQNPILVLSRHARNAKYQYKNINARVLKYKGNYIYKFILKPLASIKILWYLINYKPNRILCGSTGGALWATYLYSKIYSIPLVHSLHNRILADELPWYRKLSTLIDHWCLRRVHALICHGPYLRSQLIKLNVHQSHIFEFDVCFTDFLENNTNQLSIYTNYFKNKKTILYVGRLESEKGIFDLLEACSQELKNNTILQLVYVGNGSQYLELQEQIKLRGLNDKTFLLGHVSHNELISIFSCSTVLVTPTKHIFPEGRCMVAMEGLIMGLPVIAPDTGPFPFFIHHEVNGLLFKTDSINDLRNNIIRILTDNVLCTRIQKGVKETGMKLIHPQFTFSEAVEQAFLLENK